MARYASACSIRKKQPPVRHPRTDKTRWSGTEKSEEWSPKDSTLYQVLLSIQSLVLVKEPYYNEAGYDVLVGSDEAVVPSRQYSEWVYFNSREYIKHMMDYNYEPFNEVADWLYQSNNPDAPKLLPRSIEAIKDILGFEGREQQLRGSLMSVSKGALPMFRRSLVMLQTLADRLNVSASAGNETKMDLTSQ
jgi:ubiquitin-conjugating enzyme E2 O